MRELDHWMRALPKQRDFILSRDKESAYVGGFGSGKTVAGGTKGLACALEHPGTVGLVGRQSYRALEDTTEKVILHGDDKPPVIPPELIADHRVGEKRVVLVNGSEIVFRSFQDWTPEKLRSLNLGWVYLDEASEASEKLWLELLGRLRHPAGPRIGWVTSNPNGHDWLWRRFHPDSGQAVGTLFHAPTEENYTLAPDYVEHLRSMPKEWQKRFVDANFDTAAGMIWDEWHRERHVAPTDVELGYDWRRFESLDHGRRNPTAVLWWAVDPDGNLIAYDGYYAPGLVEQHATAIKATRDHREWGKIIADPQVFVRGYDGQCVADEYRRHGLLLQPASNDVSTGLNRVSEWLTPRAGEVYPDWHPFAGTLGPDGLGAPRLFVLDVPGTIELRREIPDYRWRDLSPTQAEKTDEPEEPRKKDDHACDALRYGVMSRPRPHAPAPPRERSTAGRAITAGVMEKTF